MKENVISLFEQNGWRRWSKYGKDRLYFSLNSAFGRNKDGEILRKFDMTPVSEEDLSAYNELIPEIRPYVDIETNRVVVWYDQNTFDNHIYAIAAFHRFRDEVMLAYNYIMGQIPEKEKYEIANLPDFVYPGCPMNTKTTDSESCPF